ncbi:MAG: hypothetical protein ACK2UW_24340 [Anaerolineales bacterium]
MDKNSRDGCLILAWCGLLGALLQTMGLVRYALRTPQVISPQDWVGLSLYVLSIVAFAFLALAGFKCASRTKV